MTDTSTWFQPEYVPGFTEWQNWARRDQYGYWIWFHGDSGDCLVLFRDEAHYALWDVEGERHTTPVAEWQDVTTLKRAEELVWEYWQAKADE